MHCMNDISIADFTVMGMPSYGASKILNGSLFILQNIILQNNQNEVELMGEDPEADYNIILECIQEDLESKEVN